MKRKINSRTRRARRTMCIGILALTPLVAGPTCASGDRFGRARTYAAPAVANLFGALGDLVGQWAAAMMMQEPSHEPPPSS